MSTFLHYLQSEYPMYHIRVNPLLFNFGPLWIRWYTLFLVLGVIAGTWTAARLARRHGLDAEHVYAAALWIVPAGIVGARLFHVLDHLDAFAAHPLQVLAVFDGGLAIWGALVGGGLAAWVYARRHGLAFWPFADTLAFGAILGQAIGRIGNVINGDATGLPTGGHWGVEYIDPRALPSRFELFHQPTHPYPVYEIIWDLALFGLLFLVARRFKRDGAVFFTYCLVYSLGRFLLTFTRDGISLLFGLHQAQLFAVLAVLAATYLYLRYRPASLRPA
jgi:phosphatidylglycerol:prolipoprotein diacylglycerol transferase